MQFPIWLGFVRGGACEIHRLFAVNSKYFLFFFQQTKVILSFQCTCALIGLLTVAKSSRQCVCCTNIAFLSRPGLVFQLFRFFQQLFVDSSSMQKQSYYLWGPIKTKQKHYKLFYIYKRHLPAKSFSCFSSTLIEPVNSGLYIHYMMRFKRFLILLLRLFWKASVHSIIVLSAAHNVPFPVPWATRYVLKPPFNFIVCTILKLLWALSRFYFFNSCCTFWQYL